jgi:hypothetical protein
MTGHQTIHRRLAASLRQRDWMAVLIEVLIVVVGVFLGLQAANWNQGRQERQEERRYYGQIVVDLQRDLQSLETAEKRSRIHDRSAENVLAALQVRIPSVLSPVELAKEVHRAGFLYLPAPSRRTYDELISTGNLGLLGNGAAKDAIAAYYEAFADSRQWDGLLRQQQADYWSATAGIVPRKVLQSVFTSADVQLSPAETRLIMSRMRSAPRLESMLLGMAAHQARVRRDSIDLKQKAEALIKELEPLAR